MAELYVCFQDVHSEQGDYFYLEIKYYCGYSISCINVEQKRYKLAKIINI